MIELDHLIYAVADLESAIDDLEERLGVRAAFGGRHMGRGTRNALLALGPRRYLEILAPDPEQPPPADAERWLGVDGPGVPRIANWVVAERDLEARVATAASRGVSLGAVKSGSRTRADGVTLHWRLTDPMPLLADGLVPFFIDWGESPHPADSAPAGVRFVALRAEHPEPDRAQAMLDAVGVELEVRRGVRPALIALLETPRGPVELR